MAPPAAGEPSASAAPEPEHRNAAKNRQAPCGGAAAWLLSLCVRAAVLAAALAIFLLFAAAAAILLLSLFVAARAFRHHHHHRGGRRYRVPTASPPPPPPSLGLSPDDLRLLPSFALASSSSSELCAVCLEGSCASERWRALPACGHAFHAACVDRWLARSPACPVCRTAVTVCLS